MIEKILCVDDDLITLMLCKKVIEKAEFAQHIITAQNGEEAMKYFDALYEVIKNNEAVTYPKLVLLDLNMPIMNGWEFLDLYLQKNYDQIFNLTKFIVLSSTIDPQDVNNSKKYSIVINFLSKPITKDMLEDLKPLFL